ncbi:MAG: hypothetical protein AAF871_07350 [Pseudomonadota bacterium]
MTTQDRHFSAHEFRVSALIALAGTTIYFLASDPLNIWKGFNFFGYRIFDYYAAAILDGRLNVPARVAAFEGHFAPDGTAYIYHGFLPTIPRLLAFPFLGNLSEGVLLGRWSIFLSSAFGSLILQLLALRALRDRVERNEDRLKWIFLLGCLAWAASPGIILVPDGSFYNEAMAMAYLCTSIFLFYYLGCVLAWFQISNAIVVLSLMGALTVHARPTIAAGLLSAAALGWIVDAIRHRQIVFLPAFASIVVVSLSIGLLLWSNAARFGDVMVMHGSLDFEEVDAVQHSVVYWGLRDNLEAYRRTFVDAGSFNPGRIPGGALMNLFSVPPSVDRVLGTNISLSIYETYALLVQPYGTPRVWGANVGIVFLWAGWLPFVFLGMRAMLGQPERKTVPLIWAGVIGLSIPAVLILGYATVQFRYRADLWPVFGLLALIGIAGLKQVSEGLPGRTLSPVYSLTAVVSLVFAILTVAGQWNQNAENGAMTIWSENLCNDLATGKGFSGERIGEICALDPLGGG